MPAFPLPLRFASPDEEQRFIRSTQPARLRHFIISGWISLLTYNGFLIVDWMVDPAVFKAGVQARLGLLTSFGLVALVLGMTFRRVALRFSPCITEAVVVVSGVVAALSVAVVLLGPTMEGSVWQVFYHAGFVPMIIYGTVVQRLRFRAACWLTGIILLIHWTSMAVSRPTASAPVVPMLLFVLTIAAYTLLINFRLEHEERQRYLQQQRARVLKAQLDHTRRQLELTSCRDPLTDVANRRGLDRYMDEHWPQAVGRSFSLLLIDVDHFKAYNDFYGHPAGDQCLCLVAKAFERRAATAPAGLLARWGGEEFVIVLPGASHGAALALAQQLVDEVRTAGIRHERSPTADSVTVSVGVASSAVVAQDAAWSDLMASADAALYQAKHLGRNRVASASIRPAS